MMIIDTDVNVVDICTCKYFSEDRLCAYPGVRFYAAIFMLEIYFSAFERMFGVTAMLMGREIPSWKWLCIVSIYMEGMAIDYMYIYFR